MHELMTLDISKGPTNRGLGRLKYIQVPRIGEWVEIQGDDGKVNYFEVVMVAHSSIGAGCDVHVRPLGDVPHVVTELHERYRRER